MGALCPPAEKNIQKPVIFIETTIENGYQEDFYWGIIVCPGIFDVGI